MRIPRMRYMNFKLNLMKWIKNWYGVILLVLVEGILFFTNYIPGTYLVGWDNVYPELNFAANFQRNIFSIWQEYRGLGLLDGMAHAANLPHTLILYMLSFILPQSILRYGFIFALHLLGGIGMYILLRKLLKTGVSNIGPTHLNVFALFGALFYQLNLVTVQMFYAPLEVFSFHFAFLPWLVYSIINFVEKGKRRQLISFCLFSILSLPQAFVPSVFIVYALSAIVLLLFYVLYSKDRRSSLKRCLLVLMTSVLINSYWGLPYVYSAVNVSKTIVNSKINQMATENIYLRNKSYGGFMKVALLQGFSLDYVDFQPTGENDYMMAFWRNHIRKPAVFVIALTFLTVCFFGIISAIRKRSSQFYPFVFLFVLSFIMLGNDIPILSLIPQFLQKTIPFFYDVFRFSFTKFSILYVFCYTILLIYGFSLFISQISNNKRIQFFIICTIFFSLLTYSYPLFKGNFIYPNLKVEIPQEYFDMIDYFKSQDKQARVATFPQPSYWGWTYYNWGVRGSGFIWYGMPQPTLDGAFYPWSSQNENYYWEATQAIYSGNLESFRKVLEKYQIHWLVVDHNIISPFSPRAVYLEKLEELISRTNSIVLSATFGKVRVYQVNSDDNINNFVFLTGRLPHIGPLSNWNNIDTAYDENGMYVSDNNPSGITDDYYYPFRSLFTGRKQEELEFKVEDLGEYLSFVSRIPKELVGSKLTIPNIDLDEVSEIDENDLSQSTGKYPQVYLDHEMIYLDFASAASATADGQLNKEVQLPYITTGEFEVKAPKINGYYSYDSNQNSDIFSLSPKNCDTFNKGVYTHQEILEADKRMLRLTSVGSSNCLDIDLPSLTQKIGYLIRVESRNIEGKSLLISVTNKNSQRADLETYLPKSKISNTSYLIIPPMEKYGMGYSLHIDNISIGREKTVNDLGRITVNPIPYKFLTSLKIVRDNSNIQSTTDNSQLISVSHPNPSFYQIQLRLSDSSTPEESLSQSDTYLVLSQSFDKGWKAYEITNDWLLDSWYMKLLIPLFGHELKTHVLVNNWENGWHLQPTTTIAIVYLPQYLEYFGFLLLGGVVLYFIFFQTKIS